MSWRPLESRQLCGPRKFTTLEWGRTHLMIVLKANIYSSTREVHVPECVVEQSQVFPSAFNLQPTAQFVLRVIGFSLETETVGVWLVSSSQYKL